MKTEWLKLISETDTPTMRSGTEHRFIDVWMTVYDNRVFVRGSRTGLNTWFGAFEKEPNGQIKIGDVIIPVIGKVPEDFKEINDKVTESFLAKYQPRYGSMADGYKTPMIANSTFELVIQEN